MARLPSTGVRKLFSLAAAGSIAAAALSFGPALASGQPSTSTTTSSGHHDSSCRLGDGNVKHVIYIQFDNTHLRRDKPNVPSDLEQMPHLLNFMRDNGTLLSNDHTVLISHTASGILSSLTGVYPDRHGVTVSNSQVRTSSTGTFSFASSFGYWTDPIAAANIRTVPNMVTPSGANAPAPWVPFTRAGCDVGAIATANVVLENTGTGPTGDVTKVFGNPSPQFTEASNSNAAPSGTAARALAQTDFVGFAIHCATGSATCASGQSDLLPEEPGGYTGYKGLFGAQAIDPLLTGQPPSVPVTDLLGHPVVDPFNQPGFPGFDGMSAAVSLAYTAEMQEAGVPVTYAYISDAHDFHGVSGNAHNAFGPGSQGYVDQLKSYDDAFAAFFQRLATDGINKHNTLFVFTVDEGDHFVGGTPTPSNCDGVTVACDWTGQVGEINANIDTLVTHQLPTLAAQFLGASAPNAFTVHGDDAPTFYLAKKGAGPLGQTDPATRDFERQVSHLTAVNPYTGLTDRLMVQMASQSEMKILHMFTTGDAARNPVFGYFADPNYFLTDFPSSTCETCINPAFAWNHGDIQPEIANTWLGFVGPGVDRNGQTARVWTDHTDVRPTMLFLLGLTDGYRSDGRVITEILDRHGHHGHGDMGSLEDLGQAYKQLTAPFGLLSKASLRLSTDGITSGTASDDGHFTDVEAMLNDFGSRRDAIARPIAGLLDAVEFHHAHPNSHQVDSLTRQAWGLIEEVETAAP